MLFNLLVNLSWWCSSDEKHSEAKTSFDRGCKLSNRVPNSHAFCSEISLLQHWFNAYASTQQKFLLLFADIACICEISKASTFIPVPSVSLLFFITLQLTEQNVLGRYTELFFLSIVTISIVNVHWRFILLFFLFEI